MYKVRFDIVDIRSIFQYATFTLQYKIFTRPQLFCDRSISHSSRAGFPFSTFGIAQPRKNVHVSPRPILRHGSPAAVIVHQRRTENHRGVKQAQEARPILLNQMPKGRLESRPTLRIWLELVTLCLKRFMCYRTHTGERVCQVL